MKILIVLTLLLVFGVIILLYKCITEDLKNLNKQKMKNKLLFRIELIANHINKETKQILNNQQKY